ncbi:MAG: NAD(P)H-hydrate dehydratase [Gammaproteobacteria bacterium]|nr:MAG: NAD(P)H-hydrate dehydratase [Gammaproteobacteria bacterium]
MSAESVSTEQAKQLGLYRADQVRELDKLAINKHGIPGFSLMKRAGVAAFVAARDKWPGIKKVLVVCGTGNNGGDGFVVAKLFKDVKVNPTVLLLGEFEQIKGDAKRAAEEFIEAGGEIYSELEEGINEFELIVDALLGTGLERDLEGHFAEVVSAINQSHAKVIAIDIPSGINSDTGAIMGCAVHADVTTTYIGKKQGLYTGDGAEYTGEVIFDDLAVPADVYCLSPSSYLHNEDLRYDNLKPRNRNAHKGDHGHVLVIGGDIGMSGAVRMAGQAALRVGAGLATVATRPEHAYMVNSGRPELMCYGVETKDELQELMARASVIILGPGLGQSEWSRVMYAEAVDSVLPKIIDADALNILAEVNNPQPFHDQTVITPHPGEAARLLGKTNLEIQKDRFYAADELEKRYGAAVVLKGVGTIITSQGQFNVCQYGNPGMATAGMGDVLSGVIAGLMAQNIKADIAANLGVYMHAKAGDVASQSGERGMVAADLFQPLRRLSNP